MLKQKGRMLALIYSTLLKEFGISAVERVFGENELVLDGKTIPCRRLFEMLFERNTPPIPLEYVMEIYRFTEEYLEEFGCSEEEFKAKLQKNHDNGLPVIPGKEILQLIEPYLQHFFTEDDLHLFILKMACLIHSKSIPNSFMNIVKDDEINGIVTSFIELTFDCEQKYIYNVDLWTAPLLQNSTYGFELSAFTECEAVAEVAELDTLFPENKISYHGKRVFLDSEEVGYLQYFSEFQKELGLTVSAEDCSGVVLTKALPVSSIRTLKAGCFYGAPFYLLRSKHFKSNADRSRVFRNFLNSDLITGIEKDSVVIERHNSLMRRSEEFVNIVYCKSTDKIFLDDRLLFRNSPAKFLFYFCHNSLHKKKNSFTYQELLHADELDLNPFKPNINVRLQRLKSKLKRDFPQFELKHIGKGRCEFISHTGYSIDVYE